MLLHMNDWNQLVPGARGEALRASLCKAAAVAHTENAARFDSDDLGDDALIYGLCTTHNARHVAGQFIEGAALEGVSVCERGRVWWLEVQRHPEATLRVYFYKAPPGASTVHGLRLDDTEIKKELSAANGRQLELFNRAGGQGHAELVNLIVVHYGEPLTGLEKVDVGAPYLADNEIAWDWHERFDVAEPVSGAEPVVVLGDDDIGYPGLRLVSDERVGSDEVLTPEVTTEPATSEFEALQLREDRDADRNAEPSIDQESS